jgi:NADH dehydrogenase
MGERLLSLTGHPQRPSPFGDEVRTVPFNFKQPDKLAESLRGVEVLYNTYWIRFPRDGMTYEQAVTNTRTLIRAAVQAGVRRIVHVSITNPSHDSPFGYFRGKAQVEDEIAASGLSYAILRPAVLFGGEDILINNIAWALRRLPVFAIPGSGEYRVQPIHVDNLADLAVEYGHRHDNVVMDAVGPEACSYNGLIRVIAHAIGRRPLLVHLPPRLFYRLSLPISLLVRDVLITWDEVLGLMADLLASSGPPTAPTRLSEWLSENRDEVGRRYASELARHFR